MEVWAQTGTAPAVTESTMSSQVCTEIFNNGISRKETEAGGNPVVRDALDEQVNTGENNIVCQ